MDDANTVGAATATHTSSFYAWNRLPLELKLLVLENFVHRTRPITHRSTIVSAYSLEFLTLLHVNKSLRDLTYRLQYSRGVVLERAPGYYRSKLNSKKYRAGVVDGFSDLEDIQRGPEAFSLNAYTFQHPKAGVAVFVRRVELRLTIDDKFELWTANLNQICFLRPPVGFNEWFLFLQHKTKQDHERYAEWQHAFSNVESLKLVLNVRSAICSRDSNTRLPGRCFDVDARNPSVYPCVDRKRNLLDMFRNTKIFLKPSEVDVVVKGLTCDGYNESFQKRTERTCEHGCSRLIADVVKTAVLGEGDDTEAVNES